jgi:tetratricopeptide (TPR) repeat protein
MMTNKGLKPLVRLSVLLLPVLIIACASPPSVDNPNTTLDFQRPMQALYAIEAGETQTALDVGSLRFRLGDISGAVATWERVAQPDAALLTELTRAQLLLNRWDDAHTTLTALVALQADHAWANLQLGMIAAPHDPASAVAALTLAAQEPIYAELATALQTTLATYADDPLLPMRVGKVLADNGEWAFAELAFERAARDLEPFPEALVYQGLAREMQGKSGGALVTRAVALAPDDARVRYLQGVYLRAAADPLAAVDALAQAVTLQSQNPLYYAELGGAYRDLRDLEQAERWLQAALAVSGNAPRYRELLALFYADEAENLTTSGVAELEAELGILSGNADLQAGYGWALFVAGETERGATLIAAALAAEPDNPRALYYQARVYIENGEVAQALPLLEQVAAGESPFALLARTLLANQG